MLVASKSYFLVVMLFFMTYLASSQQLSKAIEYNNYIIDVQKGIIEESIDYMSLSVHSEDYAVIEKRRLELMDAIDEGIRKIRKMPSFNGSNQLKNETLDVFLLYRNIYQTDLLKILGLKKKYKNDYKALEAYMQAETELDIKMNKAVEQLARAQERFAKRNDLKVTTGGKSQLENEVEEITRLSTYTRLVFLEYFKVSWKFNEMIEVIHERNGRLLDKKRKDVLKTAEESLQALRSMKRFKEEEEYIGQTINLIEYFHTLSRREFATVVSIFQQDFMTEKNADYINQVFNDYNANIQVLVYNWNLANQYLWKEHIDAQ